MFAAASRAGTSRGGGGDGVFALGDILDGTVIAFYNGVRIRSDAEESDEDDEEESSAYRVNLSDYLDLDIPWPYRSLKYYSATLGHKVGN